MAIIRFLESIQSALAADQVISDPDRLTTYSHDWWPLSAKLRRLGRHPHLPEAVVFARSEADVVAVAKAADAAGIPLTPWGLGSSVTGAGLPTRGGVMLDLSKLVGEPTLDLVNHTVTVPAGVLGLTLEGKLERCGFTLGHSPQSLDRSSVGGWVATMATGQFSSRYGGIEDLLVGFRLVRADGEVLDLRAHPRAAAGPDFRQLFIGSEGTLGVVTEVTLKVFPKPEHRLVEAFRVPSIEKGLAAIRQISQSGLRPFLVRLYDASEARYATRNKDIGSPVLFVGHEGLRDVAEAEHACARRMIVADGGASIGSEPVETWLGRRFDFSTVERYLDAPGGYAETIEVAGDWSTVGTLYTAMTTALAPLADEVLGHFSHIYPQGTSLYVILLGHADTDEAAAERIRAIWAAAMDATIGAHGELSHHHGIGLARKPYLAAQNAGVTRLARQIKSVLDPKGLLNPGKLFDA